MAKAKASHRNISEDNSILCERKPRDVVLSAQPCGGFTVSGVPQDFGRSSTTASAAFSTLDEALAWLRENMAQPARDAA